jgi:uncharacterized protein (TIGR02246 family)
VEPANEIQAVIDTQATAIRTKNVRLLLELYAPDVVYFDAVPPLRYVGLEALRERFQRWFAGYEGPIDLELRDVTIVASGDFAVAHWFSRAAGTLRNGNKIGSWVRATSCCRRTEDQWLIAHEHISLPVRPETGKAAADLSPDDSV